MEQDGEESAISAIAWSTYQQGEHEVVSVIGRKRLYGTRHLPEQKLNVRYRGLTPATAVRGSFSQEPTPAGGPANPLVCCRR
jgi:hypothetical protein